MSARAHRGKGRRHRQQRTCGGKRRYRDHTEAVRAIHDVANHSMRDELPVRPYECGTCGGWHLSSSQHGPRTGVLRVKDGRCCNCGAEVTRVAPDVCPRCGRRSPAEDQAA